MTDLVPRAELECLVPNAVKFPALTNFIVIRILSAKSHDLGFTPVKW